jgi:hypothetical protein
VEGAAHNNAAAVADESVAAPEKLAYPPVPVSAEFPRQLLVWKRKG